MQNEIIPPTRFAGAKRKVSLFFAAALLGVIGIVLLVSYKQGAFERRTSIYFFAGDAFGINKGMAVKLFGFPVGKVRDMEISTRGVRVELSISNEYVSHVPGNSLARLAREGYIGAPNIQIVPGADSQRAEPVTEGDVITFVPNRGVAELIDEFKNQLTPILGDMRRVLGEIGRPESEWHKSAVAARALLEQMPATNQEARRLLRDTDRALLGAGPGAGAAFGSAARIGAQAEQQLPVLAGKLATTLDSLSETAAQIRDATRKNGDALRDVLTQAPAVLREGEDLVRDGREIVSAARNSWPIRNLLEERAMRALPLDSSESAQAARDDSAAPGQR